MILLCLTGGQPNSEAALQSGVPNNGNRTGLGIKPARIPSVPPIIGYFERFSVKEASDTPKRVNSRHDERLALNQSKR